jgi:membrane fusion protein (multidrug efflux system)
VKALISLILCLAIAAAAAGFAYYTVSSLEPEVSAPAAQPLTNVEVRVLEPGRVEDGLVLTGRADPWQSITVSAEVAGNITAQAFEQGDPVPQDAEILQIDTIWFRATHRQAEARAQLSRQELDRERSLRESGINSPQALDRMQTEYTVAEADLAASSTRLQKSVVRAPIAGVIDELHTELGEWADTGKPLARIVQLDRIKVVVGVPESDIPRVNVGDEVTVVFDALPSVTRNGTVYRIAATAERPTRSFSTEVEVDNSDGSIRPGMIARVRFVRQVFDEAIAVPIFSVITLENQRFVFVEDAGTAHLRPVEIGVLTGDQLHITQGLKQGDRLIVTGHRDLREGQPVEVTAVIDDGPAT